MNADIFGRLLRGSLCIVLLWSAGCPQKFEVEAGDRLPDAAVFPLAPHSICENEVVEAGSITLAASSADSSRLVRWHKGALLLQVEQTGDKAPARLTIDKVVRRGVLERLGETTDTGEVGPVLAINATTGGRSLIVSLTRPEGRVELLTLEANGASTSARQSIKTSGEGAARVIFFNDGPVVEVDGTLFRPDGTQFSLSQDGSDRGEAPDGGAGSLGDAGADAPEAPPQDAGSEEPTKLSQVVVSGETLGWLRYEDDGVWLNHSMGEDHNVISKIISPAENQDVAVIWAGDRYLIGDDSGSKISRYILDRGRGKSTGRAYQLRLGGRMVLPDAGQPISHWSWDSAGPLHVGLAQVVRDKTLRFTNIALAGQSLDTPIFITREREILSTDIIWDGQGYVMTWSERLSDDQAQLYVTRFSCPDDV